MRSHDRTQPNWLNNVGVRAVFGTLARLPRMVRLILTLFLSLAMTAATFPIIGFIVGRVAAFRGDIFLFLEYVFMQNVTLLYSLLAISMGLGLVYYVIGWRVYVGTVGEPVTLTPGLVWYLLGGVVALVITTAWLVVGFTGG